MTEISPIYCTAGLRAPKENFVNINIREEITDGTSPNILSNGEVMTNLSEVEQRNGNIALNHDVSGERVTEITSVSYKLYKRRWLGLAQLALLNFSFGWNWQTLLSSSETAAKYFNVTKTAIHALILAYIGILCSLSPLVVWVIYNHGSKAAFSFAGLLLALGSLIQYAATICNIFEIVTLANLLLGTGASFSLILPTHYSDLWFSPAGRMGATAVASLAFPAGSAIGQLVSTFMGITVKTFPSAILITSIMSTVVSLGTCFVAGKPPTPASASRSFSKAPLLPAFVLLIRTKDFWLLMIPFATYLGLGFGMFSLSIQVFAPNDKTLNAWINCIIFIVSGLVIGTTLPPIVARYNVPVIVIRVLCSILGLCYLVLIWISELKNPFPSFFLTAILGGASLSLVPITLEFLVDITHPIAPESTSSLCWVVGLLLGAWFTVLMEICALGGVGNTPRIIKNSFILQAVVALVVLSLPFFLAHHGSRSPKVHADRR